jgi:hypothetical protein
MDSIVDRPGQGDPPSLIAHHQDWIWRMMSIISKDYSEEASKNIPEKNDFNPDTVSWRKFDHSGSHPWFYFLACIQHCIVFCKQSRARSTAGGRHH